MSKQVNTIGSPNSTLLKFSRNKHIRALIDTGAEVSLMKKSIYQTIRGNHRLKNTRTNLQSVSGESLKVTGCADIAFVIGGIRLTHNFFIVEDMNRNAILGRDFLTTNGVRLYYDMKKMKIKDAFVDLEEDSHIASIMRLHHDLTMKPHSINLVSATLKRGPYYQPGETLQTGPGQKGQVYDEPGIKVAEAVVNLSKKHRLPTSLANTTNKTIHLKRGTVIGRVEAVQARDITTRMSYPMNKHSSWRKAYKLTLSAL